MFEELTEVAKSRLKTAKRRKAGAQEKLPSWIHGCLTKRKKKSKEEKKCLTESEKKKQGEEIETLSENERSQNVNRIQRKGLHSVEKENSMRRTPQQSYSETGRREGETEQEKTTMKIIQTVKKYFKTDKRERESDECYSPSDHLPSVSAVDAVAEVGLFEAADPLRHPKRPFAAAEFHVRHPVYCHIHKRG